MNSAGQNNHLKKGPKQYINQNKENVRIREQSNRENVHPVNVRTRYSLDTKINKPSTSRRSTDLCGCQCALKYGCDSCPCNARSSRQPLLDLNQRQQCEEFKRPVPVSKNLRPTGTIVRRTVSLNSRRSLQFHPIPTINCITNTPGDFVKSTIKQTVNEKPHDDSGFWASFLTVSQAVNEPHEMLQKLPRNHINPHAKFQANQSIIHDSIPSLRKKTLKKHVSCHSGYLGVVNLDPLANSIPPAVLYSVDFINDIIRNIIKKQKSNILKSRFLDKSSTFLDSRASVINWLVKLHQYINLDAGIFFMSVRMFDKILTLLDISESSYQLVAMATFWISMKYSTCAYYITGPKLVQLCNNAFTLKSLLEMERNILLYLQFDIIFDDPIIFVNYYIYLLQLYDSNVIRFCTNYLLEILTLDFNCNTYPLSLQASSAVFLSMKFFDIPDIVWNIVKTYYGYHDITEMFPLHKIIIKNLMLINHEDCPYKESLEKYSTEKYGKVSLIIATVLERWYDVRSISQLIA